MAFLELADVKTFLGLELEDTAADSMLTVLLAAAVRACELRIGRYLNPAAMPVTSPVAPMTTADLDLAKAAVLKLVGDWYEMRDGTAASASTAELPLGVSFMLAPLCDYSNR